MKEKIESLIESRKDRIDVEFPDEERIWQGISGALKREQDMKRLFYAMAACLVIFATVGTGILMVQKHKMKPDGFHDATVITFNIVPEERMFRNVLLQKITEVQNAEIKPVIYREMEGQLDQIDRQYDIYKSDLHEMGPQPRILQGIIRCYELKIRVIEKTLKEIEKNNQYENKKKLL